MVESQKQALKPDLRNHDSFSPLSTGAVRGVNEEVSGDARPTQLGSMFDRLSENLVNVSGKSAVSVPHIVLIGGGFGGLAAARALAHAPVRITLIDRRNHHLFQPLLYQVATAALNAGDIARPIRRILRQQANCEVILGEVESIDRGTRKVILDEGEIAYDYLIVASGATHSYFGHDSWEPDAPGLKTIEDALEIRRRVLVAYEAAEREPDPEIVQEWMTFVMFSSVFTSFDKNSRWSGVMVLTVTVTQEEAGVREVTTLT
jgi:NADPH-dependent 2,4-dienoyl-CoA reductase/sulfur reductase-like enzyme